MGEGQGWLSFLEMEVLVSLISILSQIAIIEGNWILQLKRCKKDRNVFEEFLSLKSCLTEVQTFIYAPLFEDAKW